MTRMLASRLRKLEDRTAKATTTNRVVFVDQPSGQILSKIPSGVGVMVIPTWGDDAQWEARAAILQSDGQAKADHFFAPQPGYSHIESEVRTWLREQVKSETGLGKVLSLAKEDQMLASVIYHSPHYLTGLAPDLQAKLRLDMTEHFIPEAFALVNEGVEIEATAARYDKTAREINAAFYTPAIADKANSRVELGAV